MIRDKKWYALDKDDKILNYTWAASRVGAQYKFEILLSREELLRWSPECKVVESTNRNVNYV